MAVARTTMMPIEAITAMIKFCVKSSRLLIAVISVLMTAIWVLIFSSLRSVRASDAVISCLTISRMACKSACVNSALAGVTAKSKRVTSSPFPGPR